VNVLCLQPLGGLGNRLRTIASTLALARRSGHRVDVWWRAAGGLRAEFLDLFRQPDAFELVRGSPRLRLALRTRQATALRRTAAWALNRLAGVDYAVFDEDFPEAVWPGTLDLAGAIRGKRRVYLETCQPFGDAAQEYRHFHLAEDLRQRVEDLAARFGRTLGVHVRRTDNAVAVAESPLGAFFAAVDLELERGRDSLFLSTDDPAVEEAFRERYGARVLTLGEKVLARDSVDGARDAAVDLFALARTQKVIGSYWSSFSDVAAHLGGIPLEIMRREAGARRA
jgi:hypothetical protein